MKIDINKKYRTRDGGDVLLFTAGRAKRLEIVIKGDKIVSVIEK